MRSPSPACFRPLCRLPELALSMLALRGGQAWIVEAKPHIWPDVLRSHLSGEQMANELKRLQGKKNPLSVAALKSLRDEHARTIELARAQAAEALQLERQLGDLVNEAYGLTPEEVALMWETAPPRMPFSMA